MEASRIAASSSLIAGISQLPSSAVRLGRFPTPNPENPVSTELLEEKFCALVSVRFGGDVAERAIRAVAALETCTDMSTAFADLAPRESLGPIRLTLASKE